MALLTGWFKANCDSESLSNVSSDTRTLQLRAPEASILGLRSLGSPADKLPAGQSSPGEDFRAPVFPGLSAAHSLDFSKLTPRMDLKLELALYIFGPLWRLAMCLVEALRDLASFHTVASRCTRRGY